MANKYPASPADRTIGLVMANIQLLYAD